MDRSNSSLNPICLQLVVQFMYGEITQKGSSVSGKMYRIVMNRLSWRWTRK